MLAIDADQVNEIARSHMQSFEHRMTEMMATDFPQAVEEHEREAWVTLGIERARALGFQSRNEMERWLRLTAHFDPSFETLDWVVRILSDTLLLPREQMHLLSRRAVFAGRTMSTGPGTAIAA